MTSQSSTQNEGDNDIEASGSGEGDPLLKELMEEIHKLREENNRTKDTLSAIASSQTSVSSTPSSSTPPVQPTNQQVVYVSRERKIHKFSGNRRPDDDTVQDFVENVQSLITARKMSEAEQTDFVLSLLESSAKEEVKLRPRAQRDTAKKNFEILVEAFGERRTTAQLLKAFYERKQKDGESLREFSHSLCEIYRRVSSRDQACIPARDQALRDQFADNVRDLLLRKELRRMTRNRPTCTFLEVREEALHWTEEDERPQEPAIREASNEAVSASRQDGGMGKVLQAIEEQRKSIDKLSETLISIARPQADTSTMRGRRTAPPARRRFDERGNIICFKCQGIGHIARECPNQQRQPHAHTLEQPTQEVQAPNQRPPPS